MKIKREIIPKIRNNICGSSIFFIETTKSIAAFEICEFTTSEKESLS